MKKFHQIISLLLVLILTVSCLPFPVQAAQKGPIQITYNYLNPLYHPNQQPAQYRGARADMADPTAISAAASQLKKAIKARQAECIVEIRTDSYEEEGFKAMLRAIAAEAETHTGVPTEGDYIMWQYGGWNASASGSQSSSGEYVWTISYLYEYYTTAQEESQVDSKVRQVLNSLNVGAASDYEKVKAVYDYICDNVTYDHDHLNDSSYKHQFTAYAALVQGTSVCQGYALLFYRLALELGVDARLIAGKSRNEGHGWNIVELDNLYYNADTTWDAGKSTYTYFLKCPSNFPDHTRDAEYNTSEFNKAYPMANSDYQPNTDTECSHNYETVTTNPTCTAEGQTVYTCSKCGDSYTEIIKKLDHDYQSVVTKPTCTAGGYTTHTCSRCFDSYTNNETAPLEHSWDQGIVTLEPTATEAGIRTYTCEECGNTKTETIPATGPVECAHTYTSVTTDPTCTADGQSVYTCSKCGDSYTEIIKKLDHDYQAVVTAPSCTAGGYTTHTCSRCLDSYTNNETAPLEHSWDQGVVTLEPTATEAGIRTYTCANCKETKTETIPATGPVECAHTYASVTTDPTCTADGQTVYTCSKCGDSYTEIIKKLDHDYQAVVTKPTCTAGGYTTHTCSRCLDSYTNNETAPLEHSWDQGVVTLEPTATEAGIRTYTCANCKETKTETIPATGTGECSHSYETVTTDPTCTAEGQTVYTCSLCGDSYTEVIAKLPHQWDEGTITKEPTATEAGEKTQHCATCENVRITKIPATGKILRVQGENRYETAFKAADLVKVKLGAEKFNCIVVASGTNFADALPGSYLASQNQAPILLVNKHTVQDVADYIFKNTYSGAVVYILGGEAAVPAALDNLLKDEFTVRRLAGANRYETNLLILEEAGVATEDVLVCTGRDFADSLSVSALRRPILLVNKTLSDSQKTWLQKLESNTIYVVGGTNAVSEAIENDLANYSYGYVERISGSNRYETSVKVAETFFPLGADNLVLAYGQNFPDGLCGGVLAYNMNAPLILTRDKNASLAAEFALSKGIVTGAVLGGPGLISDKAVQQIFGSDPMLYE